MARALKTLTDEHGNEYPAKIIDSAIVKRDAVVNRVMKRVVRIMFIRCCLSWFPEKTSILEFFLMLFACLMIRVKTLLVDQVFDQQMHHHSLLLPIQTLYIKIFLFHYQAGKSWKQLFRTNVHISHRNRHYEDSVY